MGNGSEDTFSNGDIQAANKHNFWEKKIVQQIYSLRKCKSKPQWDITLRLE